MNPIRVLVADDSASMRGALRTLLELDPGIVVIGEASDGEEAVREAWELSPDVITMDVLMPRLNGLEATRRIMSRAPSRILLVCAVGDQGGVDLSFRAMDVGALELLAKPVPGVDLRKWGARLTEAVKLMAEVPVVRRWRPSSTAIPAVAARTTVRCPVVAVGASTGGPPALASILSQLPAGLPVSILVAQHMASGFVSGLHRWLLEVSALPVLIAQHGKMVVPGAVYLAPDGADLMIDADLRLVVEPSSSHHVPSADRLFESMAKAMRRRAVGVVLTGMGDDGARGLGAIRAVGGRTLAQDQATSVVYGMPKAAVDAGVVDQIVSLEAMPERIVDLVGKESA